MDRPNDTHRRLWAYGVAVLALFAIMAVGPRAWATADQSRHNQTVPTPTPVVNWSPSPPPTKRPATAVPPTATASAPAPQAPATQTPVGTALPAVSPAPSATASAAPAASLALVKQAGRLEAWSGATVEYVLTLTNTGSASARQVVIEDALPAGLDPGTVRSATAAWDGRTLRARATLLPPGGQLVVAFSAVVRADISAGGLLVNQAQATAAGGLSASAETFVALPPVELPAVGGVLSAGCPRR